MKVFGNMNLQESIRRVLKEEYNNRQKKLLTLASQIGFLSASKVAGGINELLNILGEEFLSVNNMIKIIKEIVLSTKEEYISLVNEDSVVLKDEDGEISQIEIIYPEDVVIFHYERYEGYDRELEPTHIFYEELPKNKLKELFNTVVKHYLSNI